MLASASPISYFNVMNIRRRALPTCVILGFCAILSCFEPAHGAQPEMSGSIKEIMSPEEFKAAGLNKLSADELQKLDAWLQGYRQVTEQTAEKKATARASRTKMDLIVSRVDGSFQGAGVGKTLVLGDAMTYEPVMMNAVDSELVDQLKWSDEKLCSVFGVPAYMVGVGPYPSYNNVQALQQQYHSQCLQVHLESIERLLDEGLGLLPAGFRSMFDLDSLLRMDSATLMDTISKGVGAGVVKPNEGRNQLNLDAVEGGDTPYLQQQNYSLAALNKRDTSAPAPSETTPAPAAAVPEPEPRVEEPDEDKSLLRDALFGKVMKRLAA